VVALGAGFTDGMKYGDNTKAAVIRLGLMEMVAFTKVFFPGFFHALHAWCCFDLSHLIQYSLPCFSGI